MAVPTAIIPQQPAVYERKGFDSYIYIYININITIVQTKKEVNLHPGVGCNITLVLFYLHICVSSEFLWSW